VEFWFLDVHVAGAFGFRINVIIPPSVLGFSILRYDGRDSVGDIGAQVEAVR
jgi:hypothetical protein